MENLMRRIRTTAVVGAALSAVILVAAPASARYIATDPDTSGQTNSRLKVDDHSTAAADGESVTWNVKLRCPRGVAYSGVAQVEQRNPASIPQIFGEDFGIPAQDHPSGICTGRWQTLHLVLGVRDVTYFDQNTQTAVTVHEPISPTSANNTVHAIQISGTGFFTQYCAAPACAEIDGPNLPIR